MTDTVSLPTTYQEFIALSRYSRFDSSLGRREKWGETGDRWANFWKTRFPALSDKLDELRSSIVNLEVMPSMRTLMTAGPALERDNTAGYNCSAAAITGAGPAVSLWDSKLEELGFDEPIHIQLRTPIVFDELFYILLCGTGVGFSVERQFVAEMPTVGKPLARSIYKRTKTNYPGVDKQELSYYDKKQNTIYVADSKYGWASALRILIVELYNGNFDVKWDTSEIRPAGAVLKTFGGRASGPTALVEMFSRLVSVFKGAKGRKLNSIECHDVMCYIAQAVVVGGVRRSALISLSNLSDERMRYAKSGEWWNNEGQRALANNSVAYTEKPTMAAFMREWQALYDSKSGERGISNRQATRKACEATGRDPNHEWLFNPCHEIALRDTGQMCNLSSVVIRPTDSYEDLARKVEQATIIGTLQATLTDFVYLSPRWKQNCEDERLLGVSMSGTTDHPVLQTTSDEAKKWLQGLAEVARQTNKEYARILGIGQAAAITCVKPEGCRPKNSIVLTDGGILTLEELLEDHPEGEDWDTVSDNITAIGADSKVTRTFINGSAEVFDINLTYGVSLKSTANHQWFVSGHNQHGNVQEVNEWVRTDELKAGDIIDTKIGVYRNEVHSKLTEVDGLPKEMNEDLAWLLGYLWGDGSMSQSKFRLRFIDANVNHLEKANRIMLEQFGTSGIIHGCKDRNASTLEIGNKKTWMWLLANDIWKYNDEGEKLAFIPKAVRTSAWTDIVAFIAGMFDADGHSSNGLQTFSTSYADFADHFQHVSWSVGLTFSRSHNTKGKNLQKEKSIWLMGLSAGSDAAAFSKFVHYSEKVKADASGSRALKKNHLKFGEVKVVSSLGIMDTFDVETEAHWFMAGAFKSHNTSSQLNDTASGLHPRYAPYYVRRVRADDKDPLAIVMQEQGYPCERDVMQPGTLVFSFPIKAPENAIFRDDRTALEQLEYWMMWKQNWCDSHNPSVTIYVKEHEWMEVGAWIYKNFDDVCGVSFLPHSDHSYQQAPYEECTKEQYEQMAGIMPKNIDYYALAMLETTDKTTGMQEYACTGGSCELI